MSVISGLMPNKNDLVSDYIITWCAATKIKGLPSGNRVFIGEFACPSAAKKLCYIRCRRTKPGRYFAARGLSGNERLLLPF
jgi:hypothetical protein